MKNRRSLLLYFFLTLLSLSGIQPATGVVNNNIIDLEETLELTIKNHEQILISGKDIDKSRLLLQKADSIMLPKINIYGEYKEYDDDIFFDVDIGPLTFPVTTVPQHQVGGSFEILQPVYQASWFPRRDQAKLSVTKEKEDYYQVAQDILFQASQVYYEIVKSKELIKVTHDILKLVQEEKRVAQVQFQENAVTEDAVINAELKIASTQAKLVEYENRLTLTKQMLLRFIGKDIGSFDVSLPSDLSIDTRELPELINIALATRHDFKKAQSMKDMAEADVQLSKSRFHPSIESSWNYYSVDNPSYYQDKDYWLFAVQLKVPLYEGGARLADLKEKQESLTQAQWAVTDFNKTIRIEVEEAMLRVKTMESDLAHLRKQEELALKNFDIVFAKFKFGAASSVDLNQAIGTLDGVKTELTVKKFDFQVAILNLKKILGLFAKEILPTVS
jgi:outer membrane protein TolC